MTPFQRDTVLHHEAYIAVGRERLDHFKQVYADFERDIATVNVQSEAYSFLAGKMADMERLIVEAHHSLAEYEAEADAYRRSVTDEPSPRWAVR